MNDQASTDTNEKPKSTIKRGASRKIKDPVEFFTDWAFDIQPYHWEIFGISKREFKKNKLPYLAWAIDEPETTTVFAGYIFYKRNRSDLFAQVVAVWLDKETKEPMVEVHEGQTTPPISRRGLVLSASELRQWLRTGTRPASRQIVDRANSQGGLFAWSLTE